MTRANLVAGVLLLVMFLTGLTSGIVIQQLLSPNPSVSAGPFGQLPGPPMGRGQAGPGPGRFDAVVLARRLDLSADQEQAVDGIIREQQERMDSLLMSVRPGIEDEFRLLSERISAVLTPDQRVDFEQFVDEGFARLGTRRPFPARGRPPPFPMPR